MKKIYLSAVVFLALTFQAIPQGPGSTAKFVSLDATTQGNAHGTDGAVIAGIDQDSWPRYVQMDLSFTNYYEWAWGTYDPRAVFVRQIIQPGHPPLIPGQGIAATWYSPSGILPIRVTITDGQTHRMAVYIDDWDKLGRGETIEIDDVSTGQMLDIESTALAGDFYNGKYFVWNVSGNFEIVARNFAGMNPVVSALFFDPIHP